MIENLAERTQTALVQIAVLSVISENIRYFPLHMSRTARDLRIAIGTTLRSLNHSTSSESGKRSMKLLFRLPASVHVSRLGPAPASAIHFGGSVRLGR